jgi:hypothetical protein
VERAFIVPPASQLGPITEAERAQLVQVSNLKGKYDTPIDPESAYEKLHARASASAASPPATSQTSTKQPAGRRDTVVDAFKKTAARIAASELTRFVIREGFKILKREGNNILRGKLGSMSRSTLTSNLTTPSSSSKAPSARSSKRR